MVVQHSQRFIFRYMPAPIKTLSRVTTKTLEELGTGVPTEDGVIVLGHAPDLDLNQNRLIADADAAAITERYESMVASSRITDFVRGTVCVDTEEEAVAAIRRVSAHDGVTVVRVKNLMHGDAETVGGYRDTKLILVVDAGVAPGCLGEEGKSSGTGGDADGEAGGKAGGEQRIQMLCELQILLRPFLEVKGFMHPLYKIARGDIAGAIDSDPKRNY